MDLIEDEYTVGSKIGQGGGGMVHLATRKSDGRTVVVKFDIEGKKGDIPRILRETESMAGVVHPRLARFYGCYKSRDRGLALVYEYVDGETLKELLSREPPDYSTRVVWIQDVAAALDALHRAGLLHRDVKSENVIVRPSGRVKLIDFGLARPEEEGHTVTEVGAFCGTIAYVAPEVLGRARSTSAVDVYALACLAMEVFTGEVPFLGDMRKVYLAHLSEDPPSVRSRNEELPEALDAVFARGLAKMPGDRHPTAREFADELTRVMVEGGMVDEKAVDPAARYEDADWSHLRVPWYRRTGAQVAGAAALAALLAAAVLR